MTSRGWSDRIVLFIAQGCGLGWSRIAPGTVGSAGALLAAAGIKVLLPSRGEYLLCVLAISAAGVPICSRGAKLLGAKDPPSVVLDEVAAVLLVFVAADWTWLSALLGLVLFRALDITKPWPIRALERLPAGWGVMADDLAAGAVVAAALCGLQRLIG